MPPITDTTHIVPVDQIDNTVEILKLVLGFLNPALLAFIVWIQGRQGRKINEIHQFTNSDLGASYQIVYDLKKANAERTKLPEDIKSAAEAKIKLYDHNAAQARNDAGKY